MMSFETFAQIMILLFWSIMLIVGSAGVTIWIRERFADRSAKRAQADEACSPIPTAPKKRFSRHLIPSNRVVGGCRR